MLKRIVLVERVVRFVWFLFAAASVTIAAAAADLQNGFRNPPNSARPWVYWFWLNGNLTSNGITADLEAMQRVGIGGVLIMEVDQGAPKGDADFGGTKWRQLFKHVLTEANRLGLEVNMNNDAGWCGSGGPWVRPEMSMQKLVWTETTVEGPKTFDETLKKPETIAGYYEDITVMAFPACGDYRIDNFQAKSALVPQHAQSQPTSYPSLSKDQIIQRDAIVEIKSSMSADGHLKWEVPIGKWTIVRFGHTSTGKDNHPAPEPGRGLETDKLSKKATEVMFDGLMKKIITDSKSLVPKALVSTHIDSWETGSQNWSPLLREDFKRLRGYDMFTYLPVVTGRVVDSLEVSERFLWDLRQTVSDLVIDNYAEHLRELAHKYGVRLSIEAYDGTPCDDMKYAGRADEPMAEFWSVGYNASYSCTEMASAAHVYGKPILGAEAFTATDAEKWQLHPAMIKAEGDWAFCEGINRFVFHRYAMQPWSNYAPGMSMGPWGLHYERTQTWWEQSKPWHGYLTRCQYLLQQGLFVADVCYVEPENAPQRWMPPLPNRDERTPERPVYNFDGATPEAVLTRMKVKNGRIVLPDGMNYRVLVLPPVQTMTPKLLRKIQQLTEDGATVIGPRPVRSPSLSSYPKCDEEVRALTKELFGETIPGNLSPRKVGKGLVWETKLGSSEYELPSTTKWIWYPEGQPQHAAPVGKRYFRRVINVEDATQVQSAIALMTADNEFVLSINGKQVGSGDNFSHLVKMPIAQYLRTGANEFTAVAVNGASEPNPAGLIGAVKIQYKNGERMEAATDKSWEAAKTADSEWKKAKELGRVEMAPWHLMRSTQISEMPEVARVLEALNVPPDFSADAKLRYIHKKLPNIDVYFVANGSTSWVEANCTFRVCGKAPEIWNPLDGEVQKNVTWQQKGDRTTLRLRLDPSGSCFIVFRDRSTAGADQLVAHGMQETLPVAMRVEGAWDVAFDAKRGAPASVAIPTLTSWSESADAGVKYYSGPATYRKTIDVPEDLVGAKQRIYLDLGKVEVMADVKVNGKKLGICWRTPYRLDVTDALKAGKNDLEIKVVNLWINRMIGDESLTDDCDRNPKGTLKKWPDWVNEGKASPTGRFTFTSWKLWHKNDALMPSGLLGPVTLQTAPPQN